MGYTDLAIYQDGMPDWLLRGHRIEHGAAPARR
jgi:hypothetical protein